jgi:hypothetical protein
MPESPGFPYPGRAQGEKTFLPFRIDTEVTKDDRNRERMRTIEAVHMQQAINSVTLDRTSQLPRHDTRL